MGGDGPPALIRLLGLQLGFVDQTSNGSRDGGEDDGLQRATGRSVERDRCADNKFRWFLDLLWLLKYKQNCR